MTDTYTHPDWLAFVRAIRAAPDEDTPRLVAADWLQEHGEEARAEFIRVQAELWRRGCRGEDHELFSPEELPIVNGLAARERDLLGPYEKPGEYGRNSWVWFAEALRWASMHVLARGFIEHVTCAAKDWAAHGDAILVEHPVRRVTLTTDVEGATLPREFWRDPFTDWTKLADIFEEYARRQAPDGRPILTPNEVQWADVLGRRWPGVTFDFRCGGLLGYSDPNVGVYEPIDHGSSGEATT